MPYCVVWVFCRVFFVSVPFSEIFTGKIEGMLFFFASRVSDKAPREQKRSEIN